jgi:cytoskeletal protein RodZ
VRLRSGVSLEEISRATRIPLRFLEALEAEQFAALPAPVFIRGFIRAYCEAVGAPVEDALALYRGRGETAPPSRPAVRSAARRSSVHGPVVVSVVLLLVLGAALLAVTHLLQAGRQPAVVPQAREREQRAASPAALPAPPAAPEVREPAPVASAIAATTRSVPSASPSEGGSAPAPAAGPAGAGGSGGAAGSGAAALESDPPTSPYRLVARANQPTWVRVRMEDGRAIEDTIRPGETREWVSNTPFVLTIGNAGALTLELNGRRLPALGTPGAVIPRLVIPPAPSQ